jgi:hypothetical protein
MSKRPVINFLGLLLRKYLTESNSSGLLKHRDADRSHSNGYDLLPRESSVCKEVVKAKHRALAPTRAGSKRDLLQRQKANPENSAYLLIHEALCRVEGTQTKPVPAWVLS